MQNIYDKVFSIVRETLKESRVTLSDIQVTDKLSEIGIDSLSFIKIMVLIEIEFAIEFNDEDLDIIIFETVEDLCNCVITLIDVERISG
ncbi:acyl carrier protein [Paenibacillus wynnii]|uniref:acyl carrier protein n=1 Tax=Paenibacillus wynnii TaxID=268407 RepID=UPI002793D71D|nr:acyl carrier protein [Paenibacillus wynnii]MDQ0192373.1 acyl carrier protein [Paenibacillus wynnii]